MNCKNCGKDISTEKKFITTNLCEECFESLPEEERKIIEQEELEYKSQLSTVDKIGKDSKSHKLKIIVFAVLLIAAFVIYQLGGQWAIHIIGVAIVAGILYAIYETLIEILTGLLIIIAGIISYYLAKENILPPLWSIIICGLISGFLISPFLVITDVKKLKRKI